MGDFFRGTNLFPPASVTDRQWDVPVSAALETNWAGNVAYSASAVHRPRSLDQLQELVASARQIRALGSRHSFNDLADTSGQLVTLGELDGEVVIDTSKRCVSLPAGMRYGDLALQLDSAGWALSNMASLPHISVAGAVATGTHGSGDANPTLSAAVRALDLVTADGSVVTLKRGDPDFPGVVVNLGALGIVSRLTLDIEPTFRMRQDVYHGLAWSRLVADFNEISGAGYSVSINPDWRRGSASTVRVKSRSLQAPDNILGAERGRPEPATVARATDCSGETGNWLDRLPHFKLEFMPSYGDELQSEYLLPRKHAGEALEALSTIGWLLAPAQYSAEVRTICADDLWLSPAYDQDTVGIHFTWRCSTDTVAPILSRIESLLAPFHARPHWGKLFAMHPSDTRALFPRFADVFMLRNRLDPERKFANRYTSLLFGG